MTKSQLNVKIATEAAEQSLYIFLRSGLNYWQGYSIKMVDDYFILIHRSYTADGYKNVKRYMSIGEISEMEEISIEIPEV